ncbi:MAG: DNA-processing protein DprA [Proteobacteria bacterium]|nr:DNA-processing protein DprA [Pseudomonadota bacterium]
MDRDELAAWLRLTLSEGVGNESARRLLAAFGLPQAIFSQSLAALEQVVSAPQAAQLLADPEGLAPLLETTWAWLQGQDETGQRRIITLGDPAYPASLLATEDPPLLLYMMGQALDAHALSRCVAIVGSRNPTPQGEANAQQFAKALAGAGLTVVSGMALGVDGAAHRGALEGAAAGQLATIAVVGTGLDRVYPKRHLALAHAIARQGVIVSEYPLGTPPLAPNFPKRNRIIAGLGAGTLVVEAALQSGSLITARMAVEQGKDVFAIPGSIHSPQSRGCHLLLKQGAKLVESAQDVLEELRLDSPAMPAAQMEPSSAEATANTARHAPLLRVLGFDPVGLDALVARTGMDAATLQAHLLELELEGHVGRLPGGLFQRSASA